MITKTEVLEHLRDVVEGTGEDYVYQPTTPDGVPAARHDGGSCWYIRDGLYSCIAARVLHRLGVSRDELASQEGKSIRFAIYCLGVDFDEGAIEPLAYAQTAQDHGATWGEALRCAEEDIVYGI